MTDPISDPYLPHIPNEVSVRKIGKVREAAIELAHILEDVPDPRYRALAKTSLEESTMWAVKGHALAKEV